MGRMCGGCQSTWGGLKICHCSACHRTFSVLLHFDAHRVRGKCQDPALMKSADGAPRFKLNKYGTWVGAGTSPHAKDEDE